MRQCKFNLRKRNHHVLFRKYIITCNFVSWLAILEGSIKFRGERGQSMCYIIAIIRKQRRTLRWTIKSSIKFCSKYFFRDCMQERKRKKKPRVLLIETYSVQVSQLSVLKHLSLLEVWWSSWCDVGVQLSDLTKTEYPSVAWLITAAFCRATTSSFWREAFKLWN